MVYLVIKDLSKDAEDVIMVTSSIMKDTAAVGSDVVYRANAIRALCRIIDVRLSDTPPRQRARVCEKDEVLTIRYDRPQQSKQ